MKRSDRIEEGIELRKITRKRINKIKRLKTQIEEIKEIEIEATEYNGLELLYDLNIEKGLIIEETNKIEAKMEKLKIPKRVIDIITKVSFVNIMNKRNQII